MTTTRRASAAVPVLVALALAVMPAAARATFPGSNGRIAFAYWGGIRSINPDGSGEAQLTSVQGDENPAWSPDGGRIAFERKIYPGPSEGAIMVMAADGSGQTALTPLDDGLVDRAPTWSPDGQSIAFARDAPGGCNDVDVMNADGSNVRTVLAATQAPCGKRMPSWSPRGDMIAFAGGFGDTSSFGVYTMRPDGTDVRRVTHDYPSTGGPDWSPAGDRLVYGGVFTLAPDGSGFHHVPTCPQSAPCATYSPAWSPDGTRFATSSSDELWTFDDAGGDAQPLPASCCFGTILNLSWQPLPPPPDRPGYPRPRGATPLNVSLVPAYSECTSPNSSHGASLAFGSCNPPQPTTKALTFGTPDANGQGARSIGRVIFGTRLDNPDTSADEGDVTVTASLSDVRCAISMARYCQGGALSDYTGSLQLFASLRMTDRHNGGSSRESATVTDWIQFAMNIPCMPTTLDLATGSLCAVDTSIDAVIPGMVRSGNRAILEMGQVGVRDAGIDDDQVSAFDTVAVQGLFVP